MTRALRRMAITLFALSLLAQGWSVAPAQAAQPAGLSYQVTAESWPDSVCVGDGVELQVSIQRTTKVNGQAYRQWVVGGYVLGDISNTRIGHFEPGDAGRLVGAEPDHAAYLVFRADSAGRTEIEFTIRNTGEDLRVGTGFPTSSGKITVEVTDCFDAYTSGLATKFTEKDMGDLSKPFFLTGYTPNVQGVTTESQLMFFSPNPRDHTRGGYAFVDTAWTSGGGGRCTAYVSGRYDVVLYGDPARPVEGDLLMKGSGVVVCPGQSLLIDYRDAPGFQIGFRPRAATR
jgi:hypothetical protein